MIILGAGLAGCIAGHLFPGSLLLEAGKPEDVGQHKALLRFRSDAISRITGIPFRKVRVHKRINYNGSSSTDSIRLSNHYSLKVTGHITDRSIGSLESVDRWIAPDDFHAQMIRRLNVQFNWRLKTASKVLLMAEENPGQEHNSSVDCWDREGNQVISTIPLQAMLKAIGQWEQFPMRLERQPIYVQRAKIHNCDVFQTIYFPGAETDVYRASITGDTFIMESIHSEPTDKDWDLVCEAFGIDPDSLDIGVTTQQRFGKILPLPDDERHAILMRITQDANIYSMGRYACWRNLLLDDLPADAEKIRGMMRMTEYQRKLESVR